MFKLEYRRFLNNVFSVNKRKKTHKHEWVQDPHDKHRDICLTCNASRCHCKCGLKK